MNLTRTRVLSFLLFALCWAGELYAKPNVVILFTDDQGTLDANCYGSKDLLTPTIDKLAATGVRFTQAYAHTVCCPARAALLTGRHPQRSGVNHWTQGDMNGPKGINMVLDEVTLAEVLKEHGYRTALFGKWHLGSHRDEGPKKQGFDEFFGIRDGFIDNYNHYFLHGTGFHDLYEGTTPVKADGQYFPEIMTKRCLQFIEENEKRPFFLYAPFNIPHYPEQAPKHFAKGFKDMKDPARKSYAIIMKATDYYMGLIVDKLETLKLRENTIIIYMSDNGHSEETGNRIRVDNHKSGHPKGHFYGASGGGFTGKWRGQKGSFHEGGIRVPFIVRWPGTVPSKEVSQHISGFQDIFPTFLELAEIESDHKVDGISMVPTLLGKKGQRQHDYLYWEFGERGGAQAVLKGNWKGVRRNTSRNPNSSIEIYNLKNDLAETTNLARIQKKLLKEFKAVLKREHVAQ